MVVVSPLQGLASGGLSRHTRRPWWGYRGPEASQWAEEPTVGPQCQGRLALPPPGCRWLLPTHCLAAAHCLGHWNPSVFSPWIVSGPLWLWQDIFQGELCCALRFHSAPMSCVPVCPTRRLCLWCWSCTWTVEGCGLVFFLQVSKTSGDINLNKLGAGKRKEPSFPRREQPRKMQQTAVCIPASPPQGSASG